MKNNKTLNRESNTERQISVMQAYVVGKKIQFKSKRSTIWYDVGRNGPEWDWSNNDYRVKPNEEYTPYKNTEEEEDE